jgi:hypothetical protein
MEKINECLARLRRSIKMASLPIGILEISPSELLPTGPVIEATKSDVSNSTTRAIIRLTDTWSTGDINAYVEYDDREADGSVTTNLSIFLWAGIFPVTPGDWWFRVVDAGSYDVMRIVQDSVDYDFDDEVQLIDYTQIKLWVLDPIPFLEKTQTGHVYLDICANDGGAPDGNWVRREILFMSTTTGAEPEMNWWGDLLVIEDIGSSPEPKIEWLANAGAGPANQCNAEYTTQEGLAYSRWYRNTPQTQGDFEVWIDVVSDPNTSLVIKDYLDSVQDISGGYADDFELVGAYAYLDMSGASVDEEYTAEISVYTMNSNDSWREVLRHITLYGKKTA